MFEFSPVKEKRIGPYALRNKYAQSKVFIKTDKTIIITILIVSIRKEIKTLGISQCSPAS